MTYSIPSVDSNLSLDIFSLVPLGYYQAWYRLFLEYRNWIRTWRTLGWVNLGHIPLHLRHSVLTMEGETQDVGIPGSQIYNDKSQSRSEIERGVSIRSKDEIPVV